MPSARIAASVLAMATLLPACGTEGTNPDDAARPSEEIPVQTVSPTSTPAPTPVPTPNMVSTTCPPGRENEGLEYEYDLNEFRPFQAVGEFCGKITVTETRATMRAAHWGTNLNATAPSGSAVSSAWKEASDHWASGGLNTGPQLRVECIDGKLRFKIWLGAPLAAQIAQTPVAHRFDDGESKSVTWEADTDILNPLFPVADHMVVLPDAGRREFLRLLRSSYEFVWDYDDETFVGRAVFRLDGFDSDVEPVLQKCGY